MTAAERAGLLYVTAGASFVSRLPNTTVWGVFTSAQAANDAFDRALDVTSRQVGYKVVLEKRCTITKAGLLIKSDRRKRPELTWTGDTAFETSRLHQRNDPFFR